MKKTIFFVFLVGSVVAYLLYQREQGVLKAQISGLSPIEQTWFSPQEQASFWEFLVSHQAQNSTRMDDILKGIDISELRKKWVFHQNGSNLIFKILPSHFQKEELLNRVVDGIKEYLEKRRETSAKALSEELEKLKIAFEESQKELVEFQKNNRVFTVEVSFEEGERELNSALALAKEKLKKLDHQSIVLKALDQGDHFTLRHIDIDLPSAKKYRALEQEYEDHRARYKSKHPKMVGLKAELGALKKVLFDALFQQKNILKIQIRNLEASFEELKREMLTAAPLEEKLKHLAKEAERHEGAYRQTISEYQRLMRKGDYRVLGALLLKETKGNQKRALFYFGGAFLLFLLTIGTVLLFDKRIYHPRHITQADLSLLAVTPKLSAKDHRLSLHYKPDSLYSKSILLVRNRLLSQHKEGSPILVVTSLAKTRTHAWGSSVSLVSNLAISLAQSQKKVLLIDCQFRSPRQHLHFRLENRGLAQLFQQSPPVDKIVSKVEIPNLYVLPAGEGLTLKSLCSDVFDQWLQLFRKQYDFILLDAPSMSVETDSILIAQKTDGVILTVPSGSVTGQTLRWAKNEFHRAGVKVIGVILKEVSSDKVQAWNEISSAPTRALSRMST